MSHDAASLLTTPDTDEHRSRKCRFRMPLLSPHAQHMPRSGIRRVMDAAWQQGGQVIGMHVGEPDFLPPRHVLEAARSSYANGETHYVPNAGVPSLRQAISTKLADHNRLDVAAEQVIVTAGGMQALHLALSMTLSAGDEALIPEPGWPNFRMAVELQGATAVGYALSPVHKFVPQVADLEKLVTPRTKVLVVNSPSNPLGMVIPAETLEQLVHFAERHNIWLVSDECYDGLTYDVPHVSTAAFDSTGVVLSAFSFSKTFAMTGVRVGYLACPPEVAAVAAKLQEAMISCVNAPAQAAAVAALQGPQDHVRHMRDSYARRRSLAMQLLQDQGIPFLEPHGAFYIWVDVKDIADAPVDDWALTLLARQRVAVAPGTAFGPSGEGWIRLSLAAADEDVREGIIRLAAMR